ncbi:MAG: hypothetical protein SOY67_03920 [Collinsella sp.]|nr:hypothetical protein [Collinsella sp.]
MATKFEDIINGMINVSFGAAALAAEKGKEVIDDLNARGEQVRGGAEAPDFAHSVADAFSAAGGRVSDVTERLSTKGESFAEKVLDELVLLRARGIDPEDRPAFISHLTDLIQNADVETVDVKVESVETEGAAPAEDGEPEAPAADE